MEHNNKWFKISIIVALFCIAGAIFYYAITNKQTNEKELEAKEKELEVKQEQFQFEKEQKCPSWRTGCN